MHQARMYFTYVHALISIFTSMLVRINRYGHMDGAHAKMITVHCLDSLDVYTKYRSDRASIWIAPTDVGGPLKEQAKEVAER